MWLFVGLGNPGSSYVETRHNYGASVIEAFGEKYQFSLKKDSSRRFASSRGCVKGIEVSLLFPLTYMNCSGDVVAPYASRLGVPIEQILVVHDEVMLPFGELKLKEGGGAGGHNGLKSLTERLGSSDYKRLRMGVGPFPNEESQESLSEFVLSKFREEEKICIPELLSRAIDVLGMVLELPFSDVMNKLNARPKIKENC